MFVTPSVYKYSALIRRRTNDCPIFIGLLFIHGHSDVDTYGQFFGHLSLKLIDCNSQQLTLGSDDELAVRKCFFPRASTVACSRHLKENVGHKLDELLGSSSDVRKRQLPHRLLFVAGAVFSQCTGAGAADAVFSHAPLQTLAETECEKDLRVWIHRDSATI